jgi:(p)ppGpp synthase/HD superfamily hydrolase
MSELRCLVARLIIVLLIHDIEEDTYLLSPYRISFNFGKKIAKDVRALTKLPYGKETTEEYLARIIKQGPWAITAKLCDRLHNIRTVGACSPEKQASQIKETQQYHLRMLIPALRAYGKPWSRYAKKLESKISDAIAVALNTHAS